MESDSNMSAFQNTFGWARAEVLGALVNAVFLVALCFSITVESLKRFYDPEDIHDPQESYQCAMPYAVIRYYQLRSQDDKKYQDRIYRLKILQIFSTILNSYTS